MVKQIKGIIKKLHPLILPTPNSYIIIETDGCLEGWGGILKWKHLEKSSPSQEKIARYCSGVYKTSITTIDAEIMAYIYTLQKFKIFLYDRS